MEGGPSDFPQGFSCLAVLWILPLPTVFMYGAFTLSGLPSQAVPLTDRLTYAVLNPSMHARWFGLFRVRSPLLPESHVVFSSSGYLDVSVHRVPLHTLWIGVWMIRVLRIGFPHSDICGSKIICISPQLFAAYHVFHRLPVPRHSPCALVRLTFQTFFWNIWYPLDSLLPTKIIVTLPFEIVIFLKKNLL